MRVGPPGELLEEGHESDAEVLTLRSAKIRQLFDQANPPLYATLIVSSVLTALLWNMASHLLLVAWLGAVAVISVPRLVQVRAFRRVSPVGDAMTVWYRWYLVGIAASGFAWGALALLLVPSGSTPHDFVVIISIAGLGCAAIAAYCPMREAYLAFLLPAMLQVAGCFFYQGSQPDVVMGGLVLVFTAALVQTGNRVYRTNTESLKLRFENQGLIDSLSQEKTTADQLNKELLSEIGERKRAEAELRGSEQRMRSIVETVPDWILTVDREGTITFINRVVAGSTIEEVTDTSIYQHMPPERHPAFKKALDEVFSRGEVVELETVITPEGSEVVMWNLTRIGPVLEGDEITGATIASSDISDHKREEEEKLALERQVQHAQKLQSLGVLAGGIAHDFNDLLMTILGNADLALDELSLMSPARANLWEIEEASKRAAELARQMLAYSGKGRFVIGPIDAGELIGEIAHLLEVSISKKAVLRYNFAESLPTFDGDVTQIRQLVTNLIANASEAIGDKSGVITLSIGAMDCDRDYLDTANTATQTGLAEPLPEGVYTYLEVADTGCGMDAETIEKVFDPFFTTKFTRRGLGMSAVLGIVRGHKGALKIHSEVGKGTTIKVLFPANELPADGLAARRKEEAEGKDWRGSGTVLIADDEDAVCAVAQKMLERMGFSTLTAPDGREALKVFREHAGEIVCVLLDLTMPHMDGEAAFREMRRLRPGVPVILCSGYNEQDATERFAGKGLAGFIQKPFKMAALREKLVDLLPAGEGEQ
jgi:PAS domain S-box-containing protein